MNQSNPSPQQPNEVSRGIILGAALDFMEYLNSLESPIVVGRDYPIDRLIDAYKDWLAKRNVSLKTINKPLWLKACEQGLFKDEDA